MEAISSLFPILVGLLCLSSVLCDAELSPRQEPATDPLVWSYHLTQFEPSPFPVAVTASADGIAIFSSQSSPTTLWTHIYHGLGLNFNGSFEVTLAAPKVVRKFQLGKGSPTISPFELWYEASETSNGTNENIQLRVVPFNGVGTAGITNNPVNTYSKFPDADFDFVWRGGTLVQIWETPDGVQGRIEPGLGFSAVVSGPSTMGRVFDAGTHFLVVFSSGDGIAATLVTNAGLTPQTLTLDESQESMSDAARLTNASGAERMVVVWVFINGTFKQIGAKVVTLANGFMTTTVEHITVNPPPLASSNQVNPRIVSFGSEFFVVAWESKASDVHGGLWLQLFSQGNGSKVCPAVRVEEGAATDTLLFYDISAAGPNSFVLAWKKNQEVYGALFRTILDIFGQKNHVTNDNVPYQFGLQVGAFPCRDINVAFLFPSADYILIGGENRTSSFNITGSQNYINDLLSSMIIQASNIGTYTVDVTATVPDSAVIAPTIVTLVFNVQPVPLLPTLVINAMTIREDGEIRTIGPENLLVTDGDTTGQDIWFYIVDIQGCDISLAGIIVDSFSMADITQGTVQLTDKLDGLAPSFSFNVSDGTMTIGPFAAVITYLPGASTTGNTEDTLDTLDTSDGSREEGSLVDSSTDAASIAPLVAGLAAAALCIIVLLAVVIVILWRKKRSQSVGEHGSLELMPPPKSINGTRIDKGFTIIGNKWELMNKIKKSDAELLEEMTGVVIPFEVGKVKAKVSLGQGQFGKLRLARSIEGRRFAGVKKVKGEGNIKMSKNESSMQEKLNGLENVMPLWGSFESTGNDDLPVLYTFMPLAGFGNGDTLAAALAMVPPEDPLKEKVLIHIARGMLNGLANVHSKQVYHLDMKPSNLVIDQHGTPIIIDFGCAVQTTSKAQASALGKGTDGDTRYFSPDRLAYLRFLTISKEAEDKQEEMKDSFDGAKADAWAAGMTLLECALNCYPLRKATIKDMMAQWNASSIQAQLEKLPLLRDPPRDGLYHVLVQLLQSNPDKRATPQEALQMPVFQRDDVRFASEQDLKRVFYDLKELAKKNVNKDYVASSAPSRDMTYANIHIVTSQYTRSPSSMESGSSDSEQEEAPDAQQEASGYYHRSPLYELFEN